MPQESPTLFIEGADYNNVYFMSIDAKGHSGIVLTHDADVVDAAFDVFVRAVHDCVDRAAKRHRCQYADFWGWKGDGGLCIYYDKDESFARRTALEAAEQILASLDYVNQQARHIGLMTPLRIRIALHKGHFRYKGDRARGTIHSKDLNFCCHLEGVVPYDTIGVAGDIHTLLGDEQATFARGTPDFEGHAVFLKSYRPLEEVQREWERNAAPESPSAIVVDSDVDASQLGLAGVYASRAIIGKYHDLMRRATERIWASAVGYAGFQSDHRDVMVIKGREGLDIRLLAAEPDPNRFHIAVADKRYTLPAWYDAVTDQGIYNARANDSLAPWVTSVNREISTPETSTSRPLQLRYSAVAPPGAFLLIDRDIFFSPYLCDTLSLKMPSFRCRYGGRLHEQFFRHFTRMWSDERFSRPSVDVSER